MDIKQTHHKKNINIKTFVTIFLKEMDKFDNTCRTCSAIRSNLVDLHSNFSGNDKLKLLDILCSVCPLLSIKNTDKLPQKICFFCSKQLEIAYKFQQQCLNSNEELLKVMENSNKEEPPETRSIENEQFLESEQLETNVESSCAEDENEDTASLIESPEFLEYDDEEIEMISISPLPEEPPAKSEESTNVSFDCSQCAKKYLTSSGLLLHTKLSHKNDELNQTKSETIGCRYCEQVFVTADEQKEHFRLEHTNTSKGKLSCYICHKVFIGKNKLDHHLLYHGKDEHKCLVKDCRRTFVTKYKLTDHLKRYHGIIPSKIVAYNSKAS